MTMTMKSLEQQFAAAMSHHEAKLDEMQATITELQAKVERLEAQPARAKSSSGRDYGPASKKPMTAWMARHILFGQYSDWTVRKISDELGLSRGQVYSLRGGYTMREIHVLHKQIIERRASKEA